MKPVIEDPTEFAEIMESMGWEVAHDGPWLCKKSFTFAGEQDLADFMSAMLSVSQPPDVHVSAQNIPQCKASVGVSFDIDHADKALSVLKEIGKLYGKA